MSNPQQKQAFEQLKSAFAKIEQAKSNPQQLEQAIRDAKAKLDEVCKDDQD
jgi:hypothetical protein